jgi:hypothetical protein
LPASKSAARHSRIISPACDRTAGTGAQIKAAQIAVAARNSNCVLLKTDGTDGQAAIAVQGDNIHYSTSGYEVLAGRVFNS